jgi:hypothetical protein
MKTKRLQRPDVESALAGLKDFQCNTVHYAFERLYDEAGSGRFLVADEVGLGKTLVAKGVIAKTIDHLWEKMDGDKRLRIDVLYICSNADIASQNIARIRVAGYEHAALATRITLLPIMVRDLRRKRLNFVSFTPGTSFNLRSSMGTYQERALLYHLLNPPWGLRQMGTGPLNLLRGGMEKDRFRYNVRHFRKSYNIDASIRAEFGLTLQRHMDAEVEEGIPTLRERFDELCVRFKRARKHIPPRDRQDQRQIIGELRELLAASCLAALEPDLIILDEFQRFKHLLDGTDQAGRLARELFLYPGAKLLLLSATPYKMYTLTDEQDVDDHYQDFLRTTDFLFGDSEKGRQLRQNLDTYRRELYRLAASGHQDSKKLQQAKDEVEGLLKQVMVRTEKIAATADHSGMLVEYRDCADCLQASDLISYVTLQQVAKSLGQPDTLEYWKSSPYLLNFMDDYQLKRGLERAVESQNQRTELAVLLESEHTLLLSREAVEKYEAVDPNNARLRYLVADTIGHGTWQLLWIPPSLPYYQLAGPFAQAEVKSFTKRLVFSSWNVVPKTVSSLLSYEAERRMVASETEPRNTPEARNSRARLLEFRRESLDGRLAGMPLLTHLYPSMTLATECDPLKLYVAQDSGRPLALDEAYEETKTRIEQLLDKLPIATATEGRSDESWYWAAPLLIDLHTHPEESERWWSEAGLAAQWRSGTETVDPAETKAEEESLWAVHVDYARKLISGNVELGPQPDDLADVLALIALGSPAVTALRSLSRMAGGEKSSNQPIRLAAGSVGWAFRSLFNAPEVISMIRGLNGGEPYWRQVLEYCVNGGLQAVLDEYAHILRDSLGLFDKPEGEVIAGVSTAMRTAIQLRTVPSKVDDLLIDQDGELRLVPKRYRFLTHFALRFGDFSGDEESSLARKGSVREAFNSPFWPFVLITTSIGQEGLDFHWYCHAVVHWNLPPNPVDLEQREGRVHRYKGHAIRKNLADDFRAGPFTHLHPDPWDALFLARSRTSSTDLIPFWIYPERGTANAHIERHIPAIPLSREITHLERLKRSLIVYRMVFGQNRQEDLIAHLLNRLSEDEISALAGRLQINLEPPGSAECNGNRLLRGAQIEDTGASMTD